MSVLTVLSNETSDTYLLLHHIAVLYYLHDIIINYFISYLSETTYNSYIWKHPVKSFDFLSAIVTVMLATNFYQLIFNHTM